MSEPVFDTAVEILYTSLPDHYRKADQNQGYALKKYLSGPGKILDQVDELIERFDYVPPEDGGAENQTSDLVDPTKADDAWLGWLSQLFGIAQHPNITREEITSSATGLYAGTKNGMIAAGQTSLIGDKFITLHDHSGEAGPGTGGPWDMLIVTRDLETLKNMYPEWVSTTSTMSTWDVSSPAGVVNKKYYEKLPFAVWKNRMLGFQIGTTASNAAMNIEVNYRPRIDPGDAYQLMMTAGIISGNAATRSATMGFKYYNSSGAAIGTNEIAVTLTRTPQQFNLRIACPANSYTFGAYLNISNVSSSDVIGVAQLGARRETITTWVPVTADPIRAIIDRGAKPAGVILHNRTFAASWDALETAYPTMINLEGHTWAEIEENKTDSALSSGFGSGGFGDLPFGD